MSCLAMFITGVCLLFLLKLKWPKNKSVNVMHILAQFSTGEMADGPPTYPDSRYFGTSPKPSLA